MQPVLKIYNIYYPSKFGLFTNFGEINYFDSIKLDKEWNVRKQVVFEQSRRFSN